MHRAASKWSIDAQRYCDIVNKYFWQISLLLKHQKHTKLDVKKIKARHRGQRMQKNKMIWAQIFIYINNWMKIWRGQFHWKKRCPRRGRHAMPCRAWGEAPMLVRRQKGAREKHRQWPLRIPKARQEKADRLRLDSLSHSSGLWGLGLSLGVWYLALGWFRTGEIRALYVWVRDNRGRWG